MPQDLLRSIVDGFNPGLIEESPKLLPALVKIATQGSSGLVTGFWAFIHRLPHGTENVSMDATFQCGPADLPCQIIVPLAEHQSQKTR
jgi:hypothetical protein